jgi:hypothetical protein
MLKASGWRMDIYPMTAATKSNAPSNHRPPSSMNTANSCAHANTGRGRDEPSAETEGVRLWCVFVVCVRAYEVHGNSDAQIVGEPFGAVVGRDQHILEPPSRKEALYEQQTTHDTARQMSVARPETTSERGEGRTIVG